MHFVLHLYIYKTMHFALRFRYKKPDTMRYIFICKKLCTLRYVFFIFFVSNNRILYFFSFHSHYIFAINEHKGKWVIVLTNKKTLFVYHVEYRWLKMSYTLLLSDPNSASRNLQYIYLRLFRVTY